MNVDDDNTEPVTDLGLSLRYSNQCIQRRLNDDSGAGANAAASRVDMTFVASDPLSELVWSPHKGLRLKCANCSLDEKIPSLLCGAGSSDIFFSPPQSIIVERNNIDKPMEEKNIITTIDSLNVKSEVGETATSARSPRSNSGVMPIRTSSHELNAGNVGNMEDMNTAVNTSFSDIKGDCTDDNRKGNNLQVDVPGIHNNRDNISSSPDENRPNMAYNETISGSFNKVISSDPTDGSGDVGSGNQKLDIQVFLISESNAMKQCRASDTPKPNQLSSGGKDQNLALFTKEESKSEVKITDSTGVPLEKVELTDENDLQALFEENVSGPVVKILGSESANEVKNTPRQDEETPPKEKNVLISHSPTSSRIQSYRRKGKEKALSDGDSTTKKSEEEEDDSHESVESCNGAGLLSKGKRRWGFEQQLMFGTKRVKKQSQESPRSTSFIKQDSSFMSWISNMMKAFPKSNNDETPLPLSLAQSNHGQESHEQKDIAYKKNRVPEHRNMGFQNIFKSLYCDTKARGETHTLNAECQTNEGSNELELVTDVCDVNVTPIGVSDIFCKQYLLTNEKCNQSMSGNRTGMSTQPKIPTASFGAGQEKTTLSRENKVWCNLASDVEKSGVSPDCSSLGKRKSNSARSNDSNLPSATKTLYNLNNNSDPMGSLWITRFCQKTSGPVLDQCRQVIGGAVECSADYRGVVPHFLNRPDTSKERNLDTAVNSGGSPQNFANRELQSCAPNSEASFGFRRIKGYNDQKYVYRLNPDPSSKRFKSSETMASIFARRLDALKNILPSDSTGDASCATTTCFFCGIMGHDIRDCSEITESEVEDLLRSIHSYDGAEKSPCLCIRCFQLNHWAVACPNVSSRRQRSECGASMVNRGNMCKMQLDKGHERNPKLLENNESQSKVLVEHTVGSEKIPSMDTDLNLDQNLAANSIPDKNLIASSFQGNESKVNPITSYSFVNRQISDVPKGIYDAIKRLRLSRTDIFKWMNSQLPLSHLDGFFLRLRLGKWEEGLGGTGYYVGCINGAQSENAPKGSKNPISVIIGGIKCLVESQYVSNHDFLEDELTAWWSVTSKSGGNIPSEEDMRQKLEERKKIGF